MQSLASIIVGLECLLRLTPDILCDTMGAAFIYPLAYLWGGCDVYAYVHYPIISGVRVSALETVLYCHVTPISFRFFRPSHRICFSKSVKGGQLTTMGGRLPPTGQSRLLSFSITLCLRSCTRLWAVSPHEWLSTAHGRVDTSL
jgi:ALG11 mannosyltransferase N-terminus